MAKSRLSVMRFLITVAVAAFWMFSIVLAKHPDPKVTSKDFKARPADLFFFDDSETILTIEREPGLVYQSDDAGASWSLLEKLSPGEPIAIFRSKHHPKLMVIIGRDKKHWITKDTGNTWSSFTSEHHPSLVNPISFHANSPDHILFHIQEPCFGCPGETYYTTTGFNSKMKLLKNDRLFCNWAQWNPEFSTGDSKLDQDLILCSVKGQFSDKLSDFRMVYTSDYFDTSKDTLLNLEGRPVPGVVDMASVKRFIVAVTKSEGTSELALYVTTDAQNWHRAHFSENKLEQGAFTLLESTNYTLQIDVVSSQTAGMGSLFSSDSEGRHFTQNIKHTNRDGFGYVDFERIAGEIQGIVIVNTVHNWKDVDKGTTMDKEVVSQISFDDGRTFHHIMAGDNKLHLHSTTEQRNSGRIFSSPAPGIVMGVGNTGKFLQPYQSGDLWVSDDAGLTWRKALDEAHKYEIGDSGAILVAVYDEAKTDKIKYSLDYGKTWQEYKLDEEIRAIELTTVQDSTSLKFILVATVSGGANLQFKVYSLDFTALDLRKCEDKDFEKWYSRVDAKGKPTCLMGHKQWFNRRKSDADCTVGSNFRDPVPVSEPCECTAEDFECDYGFMQEDDGSCKPAISIKPPSGSCKNPEDKFEGPSGWRLIPGNDCEEKGKTSDKIKKVERPCSESTTPIQSGKITSTGKTLPGKSFREYYYLERKDSAEGADETIVALTNERIVYVSHDHGKTWDTPIDDEVIAIYPHQYFSDSVFFVTPSKKVYYSHSRCKSGTIHSFEAPGTVNRERLQALGFHSNQRDWLLWTGSEDCTGKTSDSCHSVAYVSKNGGREWKTLLPFVKRCQFMYLESYRNEDELIFCEQSRDEDPANPFQLVSSTDFFEHKTELFGDIIGFATMPKSEFIIVAAREENKTSLKVDASVDGVNFARAKFPPNFQVEAQQAYTVLESTTHAVFIHVTVNPHTGQEYGAILKSNSNGTAYVMSIKDVNRNTDGYVDFEKTSLEGVSIVNVVENSKEVDNGSRKRKKTMITHNDGSEWSGVKGPNSKPLHLHGYTERRDPGDTFSSESGIGLLLGIGNEGDYLGEKSASNTFISRDAGITWKLAKEGPHIWEFGDQGSIVVIIPEDTPTKALYFTLDEGATWAEYEFSSTPIIVNDITTVPSDNSRQFLIWAKSDGGKLSVINVDFTGMREKPCRLPADNVEGPDSDFYLWTPLHPNQADDCLFGHVAQYIRKKPEAECFNGPVIPTLHNIARNCTCTRRDFECDYNYEKQGDGTCDLVPGLATLDPMQVCKDDPNAIEYWDVTGYRRIPLSTCHDGLELDLTGQSHPCPGHEQEHDKKHGASKVGLFFAITMPFLAAGAVGYLFWRYGHKLREYGHITIGEGVNSGPGYGSEDDQNRILRWGIIGVSAVVAIVSAVPFVATATWRWGRQWVSRHTSAFGTTPFNSRQSFSRGGGAGYSAVDADEHAEFLGDDDEDGDEDDTDGFSAVSHPSPV